METARADALEEARSGDGVDAPCCSWRDRSGEWRIRCRHRVTFQEFRSHLVTLTGLAVDDLEAEWGGWSWDDAESLTAAALVAVPDVTWTWQDTAGVAADAYDMWRDAERVPGRFLASPASLAAEEEDPRGVRNAVGPLWSATPDEAAAKSLLTGMVTRLVLHGASDTIVGTDVP